MEEVFDIYTRVSDVGGRDGDSYGSPEVQEAVCRRWASEHGVTVGDVVLEEDVSGEKAAEARRLGKLIERCESGETKGIICRHLDRFGRSVSQGCGAEARMRDVGARLIAVEDGYDTAAPGSRMVMAMRMAVGEEHNDRVRANYKHGRRRAFERGVYLARKPPNLAYKRMDEVEPQYGSRGQLLKDGRLVVDEHGAALVSEVFDRRAAGQNIGQMQRWLEAEGVEITKSGVRSMLKNRAYLGEAKDADGRVVKNAHTPVITAAQFERANAVKGEYHPRDGSIAEKLTLSGLVVCDGCGQRARGGAYGPPERRTAQYVCTNSKCEKRAGMKADKLHAHVEAVVREALLNVKDPATGVPVHPGSVYVGAILEGDNRYVEAEAAVAQARTSLEEYRDSIELQETLGLDAFTEGLRTRKEAYRLAQTALRETPRPTFGNPDEVLTDETLWRAHYKRFISEIRLRPASEGEERIEVRFHGQPAGKLAVAA